MAQVILLSLTASLNPTLLAAATVMILLPSPKKLMGGYLAGALMVSISLGLLIVSSFSDSGAAHATERTVNPGLEICLGSIALGIAWSLRSNRFARRSKEDRRAGPREKPPPRWQRALGKGSARVAFVVGALLTLPGASYLLGLHRIHALAYSSAVTVLLVLGFNVVMLWLLEVPLVAFVVAPNWTPSAVQRSKAWVGRHARDFAIRGLALVGALLILKGVVGLTE